MTKSLRGSDSERGQPQKSSSMLQAEASGHFQKAIPEDRSTARCAQDKNHVASQSQHGCMDSRSEQPEYSALRRACGRATYDYFGSRYERGGEDIPVSELSDVQVRE